MKTLLNTSKQKKHAAAILCYALFVKKCVGLEKSCETIPLNSRNYFPIGFFYRLFCFGVTVTNSEK